MTTRALELAMECRRLSESCLYTSTSFFIWLRCLRIVRGIFVVVPLVLGSFASWTLLTESELDSVKAVVSIATFLAGMMPSVYAALKLDDRLASYREGATAFKNLQDRFRQLALVSSRKPFAEFEGEFEACRTSLEASRSTATTPPEWCFRRAQMKVQKGDYTFDVDLEALRTQPDGGEAS
ncbi:MAG: hypothetical protein R3F29_13120 [Planctomycetota bacterium]